MASKTLGDVAEVIMGQSPPGESCNRIGKGSPLLNGPTEFGPHHPTPVQFTSDPRKHSKAGDILFCVRGSTTGRMNWADQDYAIGRGVAAIRHKKGAKYQPFLKALIDYHLPRLLAQATGSTFPNVSYSQLVDLACNIPSDAEQQAIAHILGTLDDKIELNRQMNATLEDIARALFKSWFVDFDPVRAKAAGQQPPDFASHIANLFPDEFVDSELGEIPKGWRVTSFGKQANVVKGLSYKGKHLCDEGEGLPLHNLNSVYEGGGYKYEGMKWYNGEYRERHLLEPGDVIVTNTEQGFEFLLIGYAAIVPKRFGLKGLFSHHIYRLRPRKDSYLPPWFFYLLLRTPRFHQLVAGYSNGTTVNMLPADGLQKPQLVLPPKALIEQFDKLFRPIASRLEVLYDENCTLAALRDTLLPKFISGELRVPGAERIVGRCL